MSQALTKTKAESSARIAWRMGLGLALLATGCAGGPKRTQVGAAPSPDNQSVWIIPGALGLADVKIKGDVLRFSNATFEAPVMKAGGEEAKLRLPAGRIHITAKFRYSCVVAKSGETYRFDRREAPVEMTFLARPGGTYTLQVLGDSIPLEPGHGLAAGEPAEIDGYANLSGGACPRRVSLGVKGAPGERMVLIDKAKEKSAPAAPPKQRR